MPNEASRLRSLHALKVLDTASEERFDRITRLAADLFDTPVALISLIDRDRQWFKSRVGVEICETPRPWAICNTTITLPAGDCLVTPDASLDPRFKDNPLVTGALNLRFYAGAPIHLSDGTAVGSLCVISDKPRAQPGPALLKQLTTLAAIVADQLDVGRALAQAVEQQRMLLLAEAMARVGHWRLSLKTWKINWSDEVYRIHGQEPDGIDRSLDEATAAYHPEDRERIQNFMLHAALKGEAFDTQFRIIHKDGSTRRLNCRGCLERDPKGKSIALYGVVQDVTEQTDMVQTITEQMARYRLLTDNANDVVTHVGPDGLLKYVSPAVLQLSGYDASEVLGRSGWDFIHHEDMPDVTAVMKLAREHGRNTRVEYRFKRKDGSLVWVESQPSAIRAPETGAIVGYSDVIRDVSDRRRLEDELRSAQAEAEDAAKVKAEFLANMSHELRTPLTSILGFGALLQNTRDLNSDTRRYIDRVSSASQALLTTVNDILDFSKLEAGQVEVRARPTNLVKLITETTDLLRHDAEHKDINLIVDMDPSMPPALVDPDRVRQVLLNLVSNAVKFTSSGEVRVNAALDPSTGRLSCQVRDSGIGVAPDQIGRLFGRFAQVDGARNRTQAGTGLGLAICKGLVELMGGEIKVASIAGLGSTFSFEIDAPVSTRNDHNSDDEPGLDFNGFRVLVVDDHAANRDLVRVLLTPLGCEISEAVNGEAAVEECRQSIFDLIIMDYRMPGMNGVETLQAIRRTSGANQWTPMMAFTANTGEEDRRSLMAQGFDGFAPKPIEPRILIGAMIEALTRPDDTSALEI